MVMAARCHRRPAQSHGRRRLLPRLGRDVRGYPIPFFALIQDGGAVDFAVVDTVKWSAAMKGRRCGVCGEPLGVRVAFVGGERSIANRLFSDLPMHLDCARYALQVCPFLAAPKFHYQNKVPDGTAVNLHVSEERPKRFGLGVTRGYRPTWLPGNQVALEAAPFESIEWWVGGLQVDPAGNPT